MATLNLTTGISRMSGKLGNMVHYVRNGQQCIRSITHRLYDPRTDRQLMVRGRITFLSGLAVRFEPATRVGFRDGNQGLNFHNLFMKQNYGNIQVEEPREVEGQKVVECIAEMSQIRCAEGRMPVQRLEVSYHAMNHSLIVDHVPDTYPSEQADCYLVLYQDNLPRVQVLNLGDVTTVQEREVRLSRMIDPMELSIFTFCASVESDECSTSVYVPLKTGMR